MIFNFPPPVSMLPKAVDLFYLHWPDGETPLETTLGATQRAYEAGRFQRLGLSNFSVEEVVRVHSHMSERGWIRPTVYQGMYNALTRDVEDELLPTLRRLRMSFYAYNPLAGGLLTGKQHLYDTDPNSNPNPNTKPNLNPNPKVALQYTLTLPPLNLRPTPTLITKLTLCLTLGH